MSNGKFAVREAGTWGIGVSMGELRFDGRVAIVTGAAGAIGAEVALLLARRGASVVVNDLGCDVRGKGRSSAPSEAVANRIRSGGGVAVSNDDSVAHPAGAARLVSCAIDEFGRIDAVVNLAGNFMMASLNEHTPDDVRGLVDTHLIGTYLMARAAWPHLTSVHSGRIVNTASGAVLGLRDLCGYAAAKGGVIGFTRSLALEAAQAGIGVNAIMPTSASRMVDAALGVGDVEIERTTPEALPPAAVAPVVAFLAHPKCELSGEILTAAGGSVTRMVFSETRGYRDEHLTPESVEAHLDEIFDHTDARVLRSNDDRWQG